MEVGWRASWEGMWGGSGKAAGKPWQDVDNVMGKSIVSKGKVKGAKTLQ